MCFGSETGRDANLVLEWSGWSLERLDEARENTRHCRPKTDLRLKETEADEASGDF